MVVYAWNPKHSGNGGKRTMGLTPAWDMWTGCV